MALISTTVETIGDEALTNSIIDRSATEIQDSLVTTIPQNGLYGCATLKKATFEHVTNMGNYSMQGCTSLEMLDLYCKVTFGMDVLKNCSALTALILRSTEAISLRNGDILSGTPIVSGTGYIYVPAALVDTYKAAAHWYKYANQIRAIEDYPEVCSNLGKVWIAGDTPVTSKNRNIQGVAYGDGKFVAIYNSSRDYYDVYFSTDGKAWTGTAKFHYPGQVLYANGIWVLATRQGLYSSMDGITWTLRDADRTGMMPCLAYANGLWLYSDLSSGPWYSRDGITWTPCIISEHVAADAITYANDMWVMAASRSNGNKGFWYSMDGITWSQSNMTSGGSSTLCYANGTWLAGNQSDGIYYSDDGINWTLDSKLKITNAWYLNNIAFCYVYSGKPKGLYYSTDGGTTWEITNFTQTLSAMYYIAGIFIVPQSSTGIWYSYDGMTWEQSNLTTSVSCVTYGQNMMVALGTAQPVYRSIP